MSDIMFSQRITFRISEPLVRRLKKHAGVTGRSESALVRDALENYLGEVPTSSSAYDLARAAGLIGCVEGARSDLSSNREHFEG
jgi:predicted DNA-binding protein